MEKKEGKGREENGRGKPACIIFSYIRAWLKSSNFAFIRSFVLYCKKPS